MLQCGRVVGIGGGGGERLTQVASRSKQYFVEIELCAVTELLKGRARKGVSQAKGGKIANAPSSVNRNLKFNAQRNVVSFTFLPLSPSSLGKNSLRI